MSKYYNKDIPTEINFVYGSKCSGKTYYELIKLKEENKKLKKIIKNAKKYVNNLDYDIESVTYNKKTNYYENTIGIMKNILNGGEDNE